MKYRARDRPAYSLRAIDKSDQRDCEGAIQDEKAYLNLIKGDGDWLMTHTDKSRSGTRS